MPLHQKPFFAALGMISQRTDRESKSSDTGRHFVIDRVDNATRIQRPDRAHVDHRSYDGAAYHGTIGEI
jgi:hypothetical protein